MRDALQDTMPLASAPTADSSEGSGLSPRPAVVIARPQGSETVLPTEILTRLRTTLWVLVVAAVSLLTLRHIPILVGWDTNPERTLPISVAGAVALLVTIAVLRMTREPVDLRRLTIALSVMEVTVCFVGAFVERVQFDFGTVHMLVSVNLVVYLLFPVLFPLPPRQRYLTTAMAMLALPLGNLAGVPLSAPVTSWGFWAFSFLPTWILALSGLWLWREVWRLDKQLRRARRMGSYELTELLGQGGMGEVWQARHRLLARPAAIKLIRRDRLEEVGVEIVQRLELEARAISQLRSPHTLELYDYGRTPDGTFYLVMELLEGVDLDALVRSHGPLPFGRVVHILRQACASLAEAHRAGLLHRDIKPANIFLCAMGGEVDFVKVLDFGMVKPLYLAGTPEGAARPVSQPGAAASTDEGTGPVDQLAPASTPLTQHGTVHGTPGYMAPENVLGRTLVERADIYALGCVAFFLLTARPVFTAPTAEELMRIHVAEEPPAPSDSGAEGVPPEGDELVLACLSREPEERPPSADALAARLEQLALSFPWTRQDAQRWWADVTVPPPESDRAIDEGTPLGIPTTG